MTKRTRRLRASTAGILASALAVCAGLAAGQGPGAGKPPELPPIDPPAAPGATQPAIAAEGSTTSNREHEIQMTWLEPELEPGSRGGRFLFARLSRQTWSPPVTIAEQVSAPDPAVAFSADAGRTFALGRALGDPPRGKTASRSGSSTADVR